MNNWDDARLFLAIARNGTSRRAARSLGLNQSTVSRRLGQLEREAGVALFERRSTGFQLTDAGAEILSVAEDIEQKFALLDRHVLGRDVRLSGHIRISLPDFAVPPLSPILTGFCRLYPEIELGVIVDNDYVNLTHRQADVALRLGQRAPEHLVGRRIARVGVAVYAAPAYLQGREEISDLALQDWIRWEEPFRGIPPERWFDKHLPSASVCAVVNTSIAQQELLAAGIGVSFQLCYLGDPDPRMVRIAQPAEFGLSLWILTHEDLRKTARIRAFMDFVGDALAERRALIEGKSCEPS
jgi:DNA-binding transcriptional LysR family regulator